MNKTNFLMISNNYDLISKRVVNLAICIGSIT